MNSSSRSFSDSDSGRARLLRRVKSISISAAMSRVAKGTRAVLVCLRQRGVRAKPIAGQARQAAAGRCSAGAVGKVIEVNDARRRSRPVEAQLYKEGICRRGSDNKQSRSRVYRWRR